MAGCLDLQRAELSGRHHDLFPSSHAYRLLAALAARTLPGTPQLVLRPVRTADFERESEHTAVRRDHCAVGCGYCVPLGSPGRVGLAFLVQGEGWHAADPWGGTGLAAQLFDDRMDDVLAYEGGAQLVAFHYGLSPVIDPLIKPPVSRLDVRLADRCFGLRQAEARRRDEGRGHQPTTRSGAHVENPSRPWRRCP